MAEHGRLIDADALKESIRCSDTDEPKVLSPKKLHKVLTEWIDKRPTIEERKTGKWIPVSELPKFVKTVDEGLEEENQVSDIVLVTNGKEVGPSELVKYWDEDEPFWVDPWNYDWPIDVHMDANEIIAWMPLPEPFKGGDQE